MFALPLHANLKRHVQLAVLIALVFGLLYVQPAKAWTVINVSGDITVNTTWSPGTDNVYVVTGDVRVLPGVTLTIQPGTIIKFQNDRSLLVDGKLNAAGTSSQKITFTFWADDSAGGDTNGDGTSSKSDPASGDLVWGRIRFGDTSDDSSLIDFAVIRYAGNICSNYGYCDTNLAALEIVDASPAIHHTLINNNRMDGISVETATAGDHSQPGLVCLDIQDNPDHGLRNKTITSIVSAVNLWWGFPEGPYHPTQNPTGLGNKVSDGVNFSPWLKSSCANAPQYQYHVYIPMMFR